MHAHLLLEGALDAGDLCFSAVRELSRVATPGTEAAWRDRALGKNLRQIEELVAGHTLGDLPDDPRDPSLEPKLFKLLLSPEVFARMRRTRAALADEHGGYLDDNALATALCDAVLDGAGAEEPTEGDEVHRPNASSHGGLDDAIVRTQARDALVQLGWKPNIARTAVDEARAHVGRDVTLAELIREALRRCPRPAS